MRKDTSGIHQGGVEATSDATSNALDACAPGIGRCSQVMTHGGDTCQNDLAAARIFRRIIESAGVASLSLMLSIDYSLPGFPASGHEPSVSLGLPVVCIIASSCMSILIIPGVSAFLLSAFSVYFQPVCRSHGSLHADSR
jgi:hypothetical protein